MKRSKIKAKVTKKVSNQKEKWNLLDKISELLLEATKNGRYMEI